MHCLIFVFEVCVCVRVCFFLMYVCVCVSWKVGFVQNMEAPSPVLAKIGQTVQPINGGTQKVVVKKIDDMKQTNQ